MRQPNLRQTKFYNNIIIRDITNKDRPKTGAQLRFDTKSDC